MQNVKKRVFAVAAAIIWTMVCPIWASAAENGEIQVKNKDRQWVESLDVMPGQIVRCRAVFRAEGNGCIIQSDFSPGVKFIELEALRCCGKDVNASLYTLLKGQFIPEGAFKIRFAADWTAQEDPELEIEYTVFLTENAGEENRCGIVLTDRYGKTTTAAAELFVSGFQIYRAVAIPETEKQSNPLRGACFSLYRDRELVNRVALFTSGDGVYTACAAENCEHQRHAYLMRTGERGVVEIRGLSEGTYFLLENRTPEGHKSMADGTEIVVSSEGNVTAGGVPLTDGVLCLVERPAEMKKDEEEKDPLTFYIYGSRVLSGLLSVMFLERKKLFS